MKNSYRSGSAAAVLTALVLIAASCGGSSSDPEQAPLAPEIAEPTPLAPNDNPGDTPTVAGGCALGEPECNDTPLVGGGNPAPLPACAPDEPDCSDTVVAGSGEPQTDPNNEPPPPAVDPERVDGIDALQIDGVWVFTHDPEGADAALHSGAPEIVNGCLVVDNTVVVWHVDRLDEADEAVAAAKAGESPQLLIGGGGISLDEGASPDEIPSIITDLCPTSAVWFGAP